MGIREGEEEKRARDLLHVAERLLQFPPIVNRQFHLDVLFFG